MVYMKENENQQPSLHWSMHLYYIYLYHRSNIWGSHIVGSTASEDKVSKFP